MSVLLWAWMVGCAAKAPAETPTAAATTREAAPASGGHGPHGEHGGHDAGGHGPHGEHGGHGAGGHGGQGAGHGEAGHAHRFEDPAAYAASWESPERDGWQKPATVVAAMAIAPGMKVADVGTGTGYLLPYLTDAVGPAGVVYAVDLEPAMLKWVEARAAKAGWPQVKTALATTTAPGLAAGSVDRAVMINVWHHIEDRVAYGKAVRAALAEGGAFYVVETRVDAPEGPPMHFRMTPEQVMAELGAAGFTATLADWENERQYMVVGR